MSELTCSDTVDLAGSNEHNRRPGGEPDEPLNEVPSGYMTYEDALHQIPTVLIGDESAPGPMGEALDGHPYIYCVYDRDGLPMEFTGWRATRSAVMSLLQEGREEVVVHLDTATWRYPIQCYVLQ